MRFYDDYCDDDECLIDSLNYVLSKITSLDLSECGDINFIWGNIPDEITELDLSWCDTLESLKGCPKGLHH